MENKPLYIPKSKRWKGLYVYCNECKTNMLDICKKTGKSLKHCPNGSKHVFKQYVFVPGSKNQRKTKIFETRDLDEAIKLAIEFEKEVKNNISHKINQENENKEHKTEKSVERNTEITKTNKVAVPVLLVHCLARYCSYLRGEGVPEYLIRHRSQGHIRDIERGLKHLVICLKSKGYNTEEFTIEMIDKNTIGHVYSYFKEQGFENRTFNKYISFLSSFINWFNEEYDLNIKNWFNKIPRKKLNHNPESISYNEYTRLLEEIKPEGGMKEYSQGVKSRRNVYRNWLKDGIKLGLLTGRRREELVGMKWSDIKERDGIQFIQIEDLKVNRIQNRLDEDEKKIINVPITNELKDLLNDLGFEKYKNTEEYILAPELKNKRNKVMCDVLSRGFSHYYNKLETGKSLTFKCLRKTYITHLQLYLGNQSVKGITGHSDDQVITEHYIDKNEIAKASKNFSVFSDDIKRKNELNEIRTESKNVKPKKEREV